MRRVGLEPTWQSHTPLKRTRIPIPPPAPVYLPELDARRTSQRKVIYIVVKIYTRRSRKQLIRFGAPLPEKSQQAKRIYQNVIYEGLKLQAFINSGSTRITWAKACKELKISESKLAHLLKIVNQLPPDFIEKMKSCNNPQMLKTFTGRTLLKISRLKTEKERRSEIKRLLPKALRHG
jgi:hypothetical protein